MARLELTLAGGAPALSVRRFSVREALSTCFAISVDAVVPDDDVDLESIVGGPARFRVSSGLQHAVGAERTWTGVCSFVEHVQAESTGVSTYRLTLVPDLWVTTQRRNYRLFQHKSAPDIVEAMLRDWHLEHRFHLDRAKYPPLEIRVQYDETDFDFVSRILEEAGIAFSFEHGDERSVVVFESDPHAAKPRASGPVPFVDNPNESSEREFVTKVALSSEVRAGRVRLRDYDFRRRPDFDLAGEAEADGERDARFEHFAFRHGSFVAEGGAGGATPAADDRGVARAETRHGVERAERMLAGERASRRIVRFETNAIDLGPGAVFAIDHHPRTDLASDQRLLVVERTFEGTHDAEWTTRVRAVFAAERWVPAQRTAKPSVKGVESAIVVGPRGQEIHTDEFGRVRVQFHWDREGGFDDKSSCWLRVSQGWAGAGSGMIAIPRVGQEVLVSFFGGDPDQPVVVGRLYNNTAPVPYTLPEHKTRSTWKSESSPRSDGFNEIMFEDAAGRELVFVQAEKDLKKLVKEDETITVGRRRSTTVEKLDETAVGEKQTDHIKGSRTGHEMVAGRISFTTGDATLTLEGPNITLDAAAGIMLKAAANISAAAGANISISGSANIVIEAGATASVACGGGDLVLQGGPMVRMNPGAGGFWSLGAYMPRFGDVPIALPPNVDIAKDITLAQDRIEFAVDSPTWFMDQYEEGGAFAFRDQGEQYGDFEDFHFGAVGAAAGFPDGALLRQAGARRRARGLPGEGDPGNGIFGGEAPWGNDDRSLAIVKSGAKFWREGPTPDTHITGAPKARSVAARV